MVQVHSLKMGNSEILTIGSKETEGKWYTLICIVIQYTLIHECKKYKK